MKPKQIQNAMLKIEATMKNNGYENAFDFHKRSGVGVAYYTIVRMFDPKFEKAPSLPTIIEVAYYSGMKPAAIKEILENIGDTFWTKLISSDKDQLTAKEAALVEIVRSFTAIDPGLWSNAASNMVLYTKAVGLYDRPETQKLIAELGV